MTEKEHFVAPSKLGNHEVSDIVLLLHVADFLAQPLTLASRKCWTEMWARRTQNVGENVGKPAEPTNHSSI